MPYITAPQSAPDTTREASDAALNRLGVKGSLSAINSHSANSAIRFDALAETILANGERPGRIHPRLRAQAIAASAVIGRKPATAPTPTANVEACWLFIFLSGSLAHQIDARRPERSHELATYILVS